MLTSNKKGDIGVYKAVTRAIEKGFIVSIPAQHCRYDVILDDGQKLWRVQVKYANGRPSNSSGAVIAKLDYETRKRRHVYTYDSKEVDALTVYVPKIDKLCWFPPAVFEHKHTLCIRLERALNGQQDGIIYAKDYFW